MALTRRQREILDFIADFIRTRRYSPSLEEIAEHFGLSSVATVHKHVSNLEKKAFIRRSWNRSRSIDLITTELGPAARDVSARDAAARDSVAAGAARDGIAEAPIPFRRRSPTLVPAELAGAAEALEAGYGESADEAGERRTVARLPLLGKVAAGRPLEAVVDADTIAVPPGMTSKGRCFVLQVKGTSMIDAHIQDGDFVIVEHRERARDGEKVIALIEDEATLKTYFRDPDGTVRLEPANPTMPTIRVRDGAFRIQGVVIGVMRKYRA